MMKSLRPWVTICLLLWPAGPSLAGEMPLANPADIGLSGDGLAKVSDAVEREIANGSIAGGVVLVARHGKVGFIEAYGDQVRANATAMDIESVFRLYSMTKPVVSVAAMMLVEQGKIALDDPVAKYLPAFSDTLVAKGRLEDAVPQIRPLTVRDLLRHTSGLTYGVFGSSPVKARYRAVNTLSWQQTNAEFTDKIAAIPLAYQPGTVWEYGQSTDVLAHLIEVVSVQSIDGFLQANIFDPLGMTDTGYTVAEAELGRVAVQLPSGGALRDVSVKPTWLPGGQGLVSTASDYWRFSQMLLNGGELDGVRVLDAATVADMTRDHLGTEIAKRPANMGWVGAGYGFGLGFAVRLAGSAAKWDGAAGDHYWMGYAGTNFLISPANDLVMVFLAQQVGKSLRNRDVMFALVPSAVVE
jgi:CubicO group peptidase (beta-lactamase class C family)